MKELNKNSFSEKVLKAKGKVLVDFYADWCGPCRMLKPILKDISKDYKVYLVDVDKNSELAGSYDIMSIPCLLIFNEGKIVSRNTGMTTKEDILKMLEED